VGSGGIVRDPEIHAQAIEQVVAALDANAVGVIGLVGSSISGTHGNREFLIHGRITDRRIDAGTVRSVVSEEQQP
jgi:23S rRNA (cytidine1920-2'-O)/16S rRNA (cytidine1409-2'-O)-methyltransferase